MRIEWTRSAEWRQAQALARCESVPPTASRHVMADEMRAWSEHVRAMAIRSGGLCSATDSVYCDGDEVSLHSLGYCCLSARLRHDSDDLPPCEVVAVIEAAAAAVTEKVRQRQEAAEAERQQQISKALAAGPQALIAGDCGDRYVQLPQVEHRGALDALISSAEAIASEDNARCKANQIEAERLAAERLAAYEADRAAWIETHGSEHLRALVAEGIDHDVRYRDERLAADRPNWEWDNRVCGEAESPRGTSVDGGHVEWLRRLREVAPDAHLAWWRVGAPHSKTCQRDDSGECIDQHSSKIVLVAKFLGREIVLF